MKKQISRNRQVMVRMSDTTYKALTVLSEKEEVAIATLMHDIARAIVRYNYDYRQFVSGTLTPANQPAAKQHAPAQPAPKLPTIPDNYIPVDKAGNMVPVATYNPLKEYPGDFAGMKGIRDATPSMFYAYVCGQLLLCLCSTWPFLKDPASNNLLAWEQAVSNFYDTHYNSEPTAANPSFMQNVYNRLRDHWQEDHNLSEPPTHDDIIGHIALTMIAYKKYYAPLP